MYYYENHIASDDRSCVAINYNLNDWEQMQGRTEAAQLQDNGWEESRFIEQNNHKRVQRTLVNKPGGSQQAASRMGAFCVVGDGRR
jgi:hypothetical protein